MLFRIRNILAASDVAGTDAVLRSAAALAALTEADLHVIHAVESIARDDEGGPEAESRLQEARRLLHEQLRGAVAPTAEVSSWRVLPGAADEVILRRAAEVDADLIVIGPHRESPERRALGTTADRIARSSDVPCLIVHAPIALPLRRVLVPTDFSSASRGALDIALVWTAALRMPRSAGEQTRADVVHIRSAGAAPDADRRLQEQVRDACSRTRCGTAFIIVEEVFDGNDPADAVLRLTREHGTDFLVLGTHGQSAGARARIGSVSSQIARHAECPVLLVPPALWTARQEREEAVQRA